jgi:hypothetical protein
MSSGVARKTGECSHVHVSDEVTGRPYRWLAEDAQRVAEKRLHAEFSPSGKSTSALLERFTGGMP